MNIKIFSRQKAVKESYRDLTGDKVIISISDPDKSRANFNLANNSIKAKLYLSFHDIDEDELDIYRGYEPMQPDEAKRICDFVLKWQDRVDTIWVNCEVGVSRSAGVAAAIAEHFGQDPSVIFNDTRYCPNMLCYKLVKAAFNEAKAKKGVFWLVEGELFAFPFDENNTDGIAKSGDTYNHKLLWEKVRTSNKPFDYYPRGRVEIKNSGEAVIYMSPHIDLSYITEIKTAFNLTSEPVIKYDNSEHYKCYLDKEENNEP